MVPIVSLVSVDSSQIPHRALSPPDQGVDTSRMTFRPYYLNRISDTEEAIPPKDEPLTSEMREEIRSELKRSWRSAEEDHYSQYLKCLWTNATGNMSTIDSLTVSRDIIYPRELQNFCNKPTTLYWADSAQVNGDCSRLIFACIYKEWYRCHNYAPRLDFKAYFANPVRITSSGPTTLSGILEAHECFCNRTTLLLDRLGRDKSNNDWPNQFKLLPICRAIIVVLDKLAPRNEPTVDGFLSLDEYLQTQSVLMVRTGEETGLSEAINFQDVKEQVLPLARPDPSPEDGIDVIRVTLATAVRFVVDLQLREEATFSPSAPSTAPDDWVNDIMETADEKGFDNVYHVREAILEVKAKQRGERLPPSRLDDLAGRLQWFGHRWI